MYIKIKLAFLLSVIILFTRCGDSSKDGLAPQKVDQAFAGHIAGFTSGVISNRSTIKVRLTEEVSGIELDKPIDDDLLEFTPDIEGKLYWIDSRTVEFRPTSRLPSGKIYEAEFHLDEVKEVPDNVKTLRFSFQVMQQSVTVYYEGLQCNNPDDLLWQKLIGKLHTADYADNIDIEKVLKADLNGKQLKIKWEHHPEERMHHFYIDSILRKESSQEVTLAWDAKPLGIEEEDDMDVEIPALGDFKVVNILTTVQPEQSIQVYFSDPVSRTQDITGLIHLNPNETLRTVIDQNLVKIYPQKRLQGDYTITVEKGIRNIQNYQLQEKFKQEITFTGIKPAIEMIGNGVILPSSNGLSLPFKAVSLNAVSVKIIRIYEDNIAQYFQVNQYDGTREMKRVGRVVYNKTVPLIAAKPVDYGRWNTFSLDLSKMIQAEPGAIYRVQIDFDKRHSLFPCTGEDANTELLGIEEEEDDASFDGPDHYYYDDYYDDYDYDYRGYKWEEREDPCKKSYYTYNKGVSRNVFASDLGIIAKGGSTKSLIVAVTDIKTTQPKSGVKIEIYNYQNRLLAEQSTNSDGMATISLENKPFLLVAKDGNQRGYLRLDDGSSLSLSMFDINGQENKKGVKGFIYGERGVWRPGDSLFLSFILEDKNNSLPPNHPVILELYTPENQLYERKVKTTAVNGFYDFRTATAEDAPTGNWFAKVKVGGSSFGKTLKIEAIKPNRLKINLDFHTELLKNSSQKGDLQVKWLHGAVAQNLKADIEVTLKKGITNFKNYPGYCFDDPAKEFESEEQKVFEGNLNATGQAEVYPEFSVKSNAPGMLQAFFKIRAFEKSGDFSIDQFIIPYSPYRGYVGLKVPEGKGWSGSLYSNEPNLIPIVTVDEKGMPVDRNKVKIEIFEVSWRWWWERDDEDNLAHYISGRSTNLIKTDYVNTEDGKAMYEMNLDRESWGRKLIRVTDPVTGHSAGQVFYTSYKGWWNSNGADNPGGAEMLTFSTDKKLYKVGDAVKVEIPSVKQGRAFVSIESGSKVIDKFWVETGENKNTFSFKTTPEMSPNVYVHVTMIQPHNQVENDLPIRLYGVQPISVEDPATILKPQIKMPDVLTPEQKVTIKVSEATGKKMTYTVAVVDEGLLDLTRFKTPDPHKTFYTREALGVKTWDMYKYVMGAFSGEMAGLLALGGDEYINNAAGNKANRFKPVVKFMGPFQVTAGGENTHTFTMPNYVGSVRTMVVAGQDGAYGQTEKTTAVKKPLMVLATLPRVLAPTEIVKLPVTVFAMDKTIKNVSIEVEPNALLIAEGSMKKDITFSSEGDQVVVFGLKVAEKTGIAKVKIKAKSGNEVAEYDIELDVRLPNPRIKEVIEAAIEPGQSWESVYSPIGMAGTNNAVLEVSRIPAMNLESRLQYLITYPHGCIEQTTSAAFPQLYLSALLDLSTERKAAIEDNVRAALNRLRSFQISEGGFSYWPGQQDASDWGTNYAGHFMLEAKSKGYNLPTNMLEEWIRFQEKRANNWQPNNNANQTYYYSRNSDQLIQAYRLYTLALANKAALGAMNRMKEQTNLCTAAKWKLAAAYQLAGKSEVASAMITDLSNFVEPYTELSYSYGSSERDEAMILETLTLMNLKDKGKELLTSLCNKLASQQWYSTQTTAYALMGIAKYVGAGSVSGTLTFETTINGIKSNTNTQSAVSQNKIQVKGTETGNVTVKNKSTQIIFVKLQLDGIPVTDGVVASESNLQMSIRYLDLQKNEINPASINQGSDFMAEVTIHHPGIKPDYQEMALTQMFPSGWEIRNTRMDLTTSSLVADQPRYQDIRDDRVLSYFDIRKNERKTFTVLLNAAYLGMFYLPAVSCEAMYNNSINSKVPGKWVEVVRPEDR